MTVNTSAILMFVMTVLMAVIAWTVNAQKKIMEDALNGLRQEIKELRDKFELEIKEIRAQLSGMMSVDRCKDNHEAMEKAREKDVARIEKDIDGIGGKVREVSECLDALVTK